MTERWNQLFQGDCKEVLATLPDACVDLVVTSPPYADQRQNTYGGVSAGRKETRRIAARYLLSECLLNYS